MLQLPQHIHVQFKSRDLIKVYKIKIFYSCLYIATEIFCNVQIATFNPLFTNGTFEFL